MDLSRITQIVTRARGIAGQKAGESCQVYRPSGKQSPIQQNNLIGQTYATFQAEGFGPPRAPDFGQALWWANFDGTITQVGDYLVAASAIYFIARQMDALPIQCVQTNQTVNVARPTPTAQGGYNGFFATPGELVLYQWPASILQVLSHNTAALPLESRLGSWIMLLPALPVVLAAADVVTDDLGSNYVVGAVEITTLGCRIGLRQIGP
jgi:hypothetical protein